jgi:uncharacterized protein YuzB (UPF0349 family)
LLQYINHPLKYSTCLTNCSSCVMDRYAVFKFSVVAL